jgi:drug/metabolite transporter (DMT)-like permease
MWAANAVLGRFVADQIGPMLFNFIRWAIVLVLLLPLAPWLFRRGSGLWVHRRRLAILAFFSVAAYNSLQYLALHSSSPINVTLIAASMPVWIILIGAMFFDTPATGRKLMGAAASIAGVIVVLTGGQIDTIVSFEFRVGDLLILVAIMGWSIYSWLLTRTDLPDRIRSDWAALLLAQVVYGLMFSGMFTAAEAVFWPQPVQPSWTLAVILLAVAIGPSILAFRAWGESVRRFGPTLAGFCANLAPLFTAMLSTLFLGEHPQLHHLAAFTLIAGGIWLSSIGAGGRVAPHRDGA